uniref:Aldehyde oxidase 5 n=1 Tax=Sinocyclocheilus rhinocerous TaxID=307959 RepID=A0A673KFD9_9TELE
MFVFFKIYFLNLIFFPSPCPIRGSVTYILYLTGKKKKKKSVLFLCSVGLTGTKYGCGGGGCGACTGMVSRYDPIQETVLHWSVNACLQPICSLHGAAVVTVEDIGSTKTKLHPVKERIAKAHGSQCGFCTPGMVMSMYTLLRNNSQPTMEGIRETLGGNLCRCTGYRPIIDGFKTFCNVRTVNSYNSHNNESDNFSAWIMSYLLTQQAQRREFAFSIVNSGMRVAFRHDSNVVENLDIFYGDVGPTLVKARHACKELMGRYTVPSRVVPRSGKAPLEEEMYVPPTAPGGQEEYRKVLVLRFFFKFYMQEVDMNDLPLEYLSALKPFKNEVPQGNHSFQLVPETQSSNDPVGHPNIHQAALQQATGEAVYYDDIPPIKGELFVSMVTSTRAHAKDHVNASVALAMSGVVTFISTKDVPGQNQRLWFNNPEELFAEEEMFQALLYTLVICVGQIIGAIVAETREQAKRAAEQVAITFGDIQPVFFTIEEAIEHQSFFDPKRKLERGNVEEGFEKADHILEGELYMGGQEHFYMETQGLIVIPKRQVNWSFMLPEVVGITLGIDFNKITCHVKRLGGGFGGKVMKIASLSSIAATAAYKTGRAVRYVLEREDDMLITSGRSPFLGKYKVMFGYMNDGTILAAVITYYSNGGCTLDESSFIMEKALLHMDNGYKISNLRGSYTAFRAYGGPQGLTITESVLHEVAARCGLPAHQVRDINMYKDEKCYTHHKQLFSPYDMVRCWNECLEKSDYTHRCLSIKQFNAQNHWKKRGISIVPLKFGIGFSKGFYNQGAALVNIYKDGSVLISHGGTEPYRFQCLRSTSRRPAQETCPIIYTNVFFTTEIVLFCMKNDCEKFIGRLVPLIKKHPQFTWQQLVSKSDIQVLNCIIQTELLMDNNILFVILLYIVSGLSVLAPKNKFTIFLFFFFFLKQNPPDRKVKTKPWAINVFTAHVGILSVRIPQFTHSSC